MRAEENPPIPAVIPRAEHCVSRADVNEYALKVLYRLKDAGFEAYLVGGGVRDLLLGREPKDFDIATSARPDDVRGLFRNSRLIGRRFRLAHVHFGRYIIEVATFRARLEVEDAGETLLRDGRIIRDNVYGTIAQDAWRRDFTVNALYYDIRDFSVVDYTGGMVDLVAGVLRPIGDPAERYREDPVRMLRAVRFAAKLGFRIHSEAEAPIRELGSLLESVPAARLFDEVLKMFHGGYAHATFELLRHYGLLSYLFPMTESALRHEDGGFPLTFVARALENTDLRINDNKPVTPSFLYGVLLWEPVRERLQRYMEQDMSEIDAMQRAADEVIAAQLRRTSLPRRFSVPMREIWLMQPRFRQRQGKRPLRLLGHPRFRAAYDFLCLRAAAGEALQEDCQWWTDLQTMDTDAHQGAVSQARKRPRRRKPASARANANA
ncbi:MAG: polynucleotide adenylyltransferase PcnB [Gammaproteobacteria bacterium]|nr:polynucleotide adenylyltransferase PcnB [Gammaproteobacteria bacterium]